jgi:glycosyltransferase involved in cell wall biosynthesis
MDAARQAVEAGHLAEKNARPREPHLKILIIIQCTNLGGMEKCALLLAGELLDLGYEVEVLSLNTLGPLGPLLEARGIPAQGLTYRGFGGWRSYLPLRRTIKSLAADAMIMIGHNLMAMLATRDRWQGRKILAMHFHHTGVKSNWSWRLLYALAARQFRTIVYPSKFIRDEACSIAPFISPLTRTIDNPFPMPKLPAEGDRLAARERLGLPRDAKVVGNAGWLIPRKRWDVFLDVAAMVVQLLPGALFLVAGDGPQRSALEQQAERRGMAANVRWLGWKQDLTDFYLSLDVMLFNSDFDAMPRTPLEAMSYGIPAVVSVKHCGTAELIDSDNVGFLLREHDLARLAEKVMELLRDPDAARALGERGRHRIEEAGNPRTHTLRMLDSLGLPHRASQETLHEHAATVGS